MCCVYRELEGSGGLWYIKGDGGYRWVGVRELGVLLWGSWVAQGVQGDVGGLGRWERLDCSSGGAGGWGGGTRGLGKECGTGVLVRVLRGYGVAMRETVIQGGVGGWGLLQCVGCSGGAADVLGVLQEGWGL